MGRTAGGSEPGTAPSPTGISATREPARLREVMEPTAPLMRSSFGHSTCGEREYLLAAGLCVSDVADCAPIYQKRGVEEGANFALELDTSP